MDNIVTVEDVTTLVTIIAHMLESDMTVDYILLSLMRTTNPTPDEMNRITPLVEAIATYMRKEQE
jgi:hypothetical protein